MDKNNRLLSVVKAFTELDLDPRTIDNVKMGYIFEELIRKFSENAEAGDHYTGRDIIRLMVNILLAEGCDDIFEDGKVITVLDEARGTGGMLSTAYNFIRRYNATADARLNPKACSRLPMASSRHQEKQNRKGPLCSRLAGFFVLC